MIIVRLTGGMGNQMFQYACGRALSLRTGVPLKLDLMLLLDRTKRPGKWKITFRDYDLDMYNIKADIAKRSDVPWQFRSYFRGLAMLVVYQLERLLVPNPGREKSPAFDKRILSLGPNTYLDGLWQSPKYFDDVADTIRKDFTLKNPMSEGSQKLFDEIRSQNSLCIHVRRTDYVGNAHHDTGIGQSYYDRGIAHIAKTQTIQKIYVFSDDIAWCRENLHFAIETVYVGNEYAGKKAEEHLALMSACKHFVIPNSSFSWWGALLSGYPDKIVVAPKKWFKDSDDGAEDLIPASWVRM